MSTFVDIANLTLARLGDDATVASLDPPEGSAQATHCARFMPMAIQSMLEEHDWSFATVRASLALLAEQPPSTWQYVYAAPADLVTTIAILAPDAPGDYSPQIRAFSYAGACDYTEVNMLNAYTPQNYTVEIDSTGASVIYTNQKDAVLRYTRLLDDPSKFSPLFTQALVAFLASMVAGPLIKGAEGRQVAQSMLQEYRLWMGKAMESDANEQHRRNTNQNAGMAAR